MAECAICDLKGTKTIEILIVDDIDDSTEKQRVGVAYFCKAHYKMILESAMRDKLGLKKYE